MSLDKEDNPSYDVQEMWYLQTITMAEANFYIGFWDEISDNSGESNRFHSKSKKEQNQLIEERHKDNTKKAIQNAMHILHDYLKEKKLKNFGDIKNEELLEILLDFYSNLKKAKGGDYKLQTLKCIRAGINRFTKEHRNIDIATDPTFSQTNDMFKAVTTKARKMGLVRRSQHLQLKKMILLKYHLSSIMI